MKKLLLALVSIFICGISFSQTALSFYDNAYFIYLKGKGNIPESEYLNYAITFEYDTWKNFVNDEFEWPEKFKNIRAKFDKQVADIDFNSTYVFETVEELGNYDMQNTGFTLNIDEDDYYEIECSGRYYYSDSESIFQKKIALELNPIWKYNFLPMPQNEAKAFLQGRKTSSGQINRRVTLKVYCKPAVFSSKEHKDFSSYFYADDISLVGIIEKIEVFDESNPKNVKKIGNLTIK